MYFWRRARNHGLEPDIVDERLRFWINHSARGSSSHDAVDGILILPMSLNNNVYVCIDSFHSEIVSFDPLPFKNKH